MIIDISEIAQVSLQRTGFSSGFGDFYYYTFEFKNPEKKRVTAIIDLSILMRVKTKILDLKQVKLVKFDNFNYFVFDSMIGFTKPTTKILMTYPASEKFSAESPLL